MMDWATLPKFKKIIYLQPESASCTSQFQTNDGEVAQMVRAHDS